jgi:AraC-like DNA-binding protein
MVVFHPSDEVHSQHFSQAAGRLFRIEICHQWLEQLNERALIPREPADFYESVVCHLATKLYYEFREVDEASPLVIEGLALEIIGEASRPSRLPSRKVAPLWLRQARDMVHAGSSESLSLSQVARAVNVHPVYLAREFRRHYRCTVGEYVRRTRVEAACREMLKPDSSLAEIALICGFHDQSHFSRTFKRVMSVTPAVYRASLLSH